MALPRIDLYVAGGIAEREQERERLRELGVDLGAARAVREAAAKGPLRGGEVVSPQAVIAFFGRPAIRRVERLAWDLTLWPEHRFEISLRTFGSDGPTVIRRDGDGPPSLPERPASLDEALRVLRPWYHT